VIRVSREGAEKLGRIAVELATGEGLPAHARSAQLRLRGKS
jgi:histidinol dehydrogenase